MYGSTVNKLSEIYSKLLKDLNASRFLIVNNFPPYSCEVQLKTWRDLQSSGDAEFIAANDKLLYEQLTIRFEALERIYAYRTRVVPNIIQKAVSTTFQEIPELAKQSSNTQIFLSIYLGKFNDMVLNYSNKTFDFEKWCIEEKISLRQMFGGIEKIKAYLLDPNTKVFPQIWDKIVSSKEHKSFERDLTLFKNLDAKLPELIKKKRVENEFTPIPIAVKITDDRKLKARFLDILKTKGLELLVFGILAIIFFVGAYVVLSASGHSPTFTFKPTINTPMGELGLEIDSNTIKNNLVSRTLVDSSYNLINVAYNTQSELCTFWFRVINEDPANTKIIQGIKLTSDKRSNLVLNTCDNEAIANYGTTITPSGYKDFCVNLRRPEINDFNEKVSAQVETKTGFETTKDFISLSWYKSSLIPSGVYCLKLLDKCQPWDTCIQDVLNKQFSITSSQSDNNLNSQTNTIPQDPLKFSGFYGGYSQGFVAENTTTEDINAQISFVLNLNGWNNPGYCAGNFSNAVNILIPAKSNQSINTPSSNCSGNVDSNSIKYLIYK